MKLIYPLLLFCFGVIACNSSKREGEVVTMKASDIEMGPVVHDSLTSDQMEKAKKIQATFAEVYPVSLEETVTNFKRDLNVDKEIAIWLNMANAYQSFISKNAITDSVKKQEAYKLLLLRSMMEENKAIEESGTKGLSNKEIKELFQYYTSAPSPITVRN